MTDEIREQLSALVDDELDELEHPLLLSRLERDASLRDSLAHYQLVGAVLRGEGNIDTLDISARVQAALHDDEPLQGGKAAARSGGPVWLKPLAGLAVAASVAVVALFSLTSLRETGVSQVPLIAAGDNSPPLVARAADSSGEQWDRIDKRLSGYLVNHNEYAASRGVQGVTPYVRIVGFENRQ
ncbi:MAG: sigma-E factor negative regulatory protein [Thiogranum sp.]|nr:sigma-E factor negative regulatory protein [Thiogranum sp.]